VHLTPPPSADPPQLAGPDATPDEAIARNPGVAAIYLAYLGLFILACTALHGLAIYTWKNLKWTRAKPMPAFLYFPAAELLLLNLMALPAAMYSLMLLVQARHPGYKALGAAVLLLVLGYCVLVAALLYLLLRHKDRLGLRYVLTEDLFGSRTASSSSSFSGLSLSRLLSAKPWQSFMRAGSGGSGPSWSRAPSGMPSRAGSGVPSESALGSEAAGGSTWRSLKQRLLHPCGGGAGGGMDEPAVADEVGGGADDLRDASGVAEDQQQEGVERAGSSAMQSAGSGVSVVTLTRSTTRHGFWHQASMQPDAVAQPAMGEP
jgi:hypothetical protein